MKQILAFSYARKFYDGKVVLDDVTLAFPGGAMIGVAGPRDLGTGRCLRTSASAPPQLGNRGGTAPASR